MKSILFILALCFIGISYAELPDVLKDPATREVAEYLDAKAQAAEKVTRNFSVATATTTFTGYIDIGRAITSTACSGCTTKTTTCGTGLYIIGGGCLADTGSPQLTANYPSSSTAWTCNTGGATNITAYAICARVK